MQLNLNRTRFLIAVSLALMTGCLRVNKFEHEPAMAAAAAHDFASIAFVKRDIPGAYGLLSPDTSAKMSLNQFADLVSKMHPKEYPESIEATDYEPMPGQRAMNIYVSGTSGNERFYYRLVMEGTKETRYTVAGLWRGNGPSPASNLRHPLQ